MNYELRTLGAKDIFPLSKIVSCIGVKEFRSCFESDAVKRVAAKGGDDPDFSAVGLGVFLDIAGIILGNLPKCEKEIFDFLASISNLNSEEIREMDMGSFAQMVMDVVRKPEFKDFIGVVSRSFK